MRSWAESVWRHQDAPAAWHFAFAAREFAATRSSPPPPTPQTPAATLPSPRPTPPPLEPSPSPSPPPPPQASAGTGGVGRHDDPRLAELETLVASEAADLRLLSQRVDELETRLAACEASAGGGASGRGRVRQALEPRDPPRGLPSSAALASAASAAAVSSAASSAAAGAAAAAVADEAPVVPRLCWIVLLDRPGGIDVVVHAAARQTSKAFRLVALDRHHAARRSAAATLAAAAGVELVHLPAPAEGSWSHGRVWELASGACTAGGARSAGRDRAADATAVPTIEAVALVRQYLWVPRTFVEASIAFHAGRALHSPETPALLAHPIWQFRVPAAESVASEDEGAAELFTPPLSGSYSSRGWPLVRRLEPAFTAPLLGEAPREWRAARPLTSDGLPAGAWSAPLALVRTAKTLPVPDAPGVESERCLEQARDARRPKGKATTKGGAPVAAVLLADVSLTCETIEWSEWAPSDVWRHTPAIDGGDCQGKA